MNCTQIIETMARGMATASDYPGLDTHFFPAAAAALSALEAAGFVVVPMVASDEMARAGVRYRLSTSIGGDNQWLEDTNRLYATMIKAAQEDKS